MAARDLMRRLVFGGQSWIHANTTYALRGPCLALLCLAFAPYGGNNQATHQ